MSSTQRKYLSLTGFLFAACFLRGAWELTENMEWAARLRPLFTVAMVFFVIAGIATLFRSKSLDNRSDS